MHTDNQRHSYHIDERRCSPAQREKWFRTGMETGNADRCDTLTSLRYPPTTGP